MLYTISLRNFPRILLLILKFLFSQQLCYILTIMFKSLKKLFYKYTFISIPITLFLFPIIVAVVIIGIPCYWFFKDRFSSGQKATNK